MKPRTTITRKKVAYLKSNVWGNYYIMVGGRKVKERMGKTWHKPELFDWIKENYPDHEIKDLTTY